MNIQIIEQIFEICVIPMLGILTKCVIDFLNTKRKEINAKTDSETAQKYNNMICVTVSNCVIATNQTFVNSLKESGTFDEAAQKEAFEKTLNAVLAILSEDAKQYIAEMTSDVNTYLTQLIESEVNKNRKE